MNDVDCSDASEDQNFSDDICSSNMKRPENTARALIKTYTCHHHRIELCIEAPPTGLVSEFDLSHMEQTESAGLPDTCIRVTPPRHKDLSRDIFVNGHRVQCRIDGNSIVPAILSNLFFCISRALTSRLLLHAAVLGKNGKAAVFPAVSGSGKTTLAAVLIQHGFTFFSDELAILDTDKLTVFPLLLPMSIKSGSLKTLNFRYPDLAGRKAHVRQDGKQVRFFLPPANCMAAETDSAPVNALIFPQYCNGSPHQLMKISKSNALMNIVKTTSSDRRLLPPDISAIINLIEQTPCYSLTYSDAGIAATLIKRQLDETTDLR